MYTEPLIGVSAIGNKQRLQRRKSLSKPTIDGRQKKVDQGKSEEKRTYDNPGRGITNDALNLNRYYKTDLLNAREEYTLGMKIRFMVKCQAVHEGLFLQLERNPTIAEWAAACGFDEYDAEMYSEKYVDSDLDKEIRPSGSDDEDIDPSMFVGNGLVTESGVGRGKGRVKKPPPTLMRKFYDDSYEKFKDKDNDDDDAADEVDIFLYRQRESPGEPINRGSPRIFREMMLTAKEAKQQMIQSNMRLVVSIARRYHGVGVNVQDLVQEGSLGLARAAEKFDPHKGFKFSTYASWWIQQAVFRSIAYHSRTIRLPVHVHNLLNKVRRARQLLQQELGRMPSNEEMAYELDMSVEKYNKMIRNTRNAISLERPKYMNNPKDLGHESEASVGDMVDSSSVILDELTPEQSVDQGLLHSDIQYMLGKLGEDERGVLCLRYGINDGITRTVTLVASEMRQTKSWVRSQECRALRKLRRPWYERRLKEHRESLTASLGLPI
jgi:RNA polymerase sigma factor (sigma-70 family)